MKRLNTIADHFENILSHNEREIKRIKKGGGAFPFVNCIAIYKDGEFYGVTLAFGKTVDTHKEGFDFVCNEYTQTTIQTAYPIEDVRSYLLTKEA